MKQQWARYAAKLDAMSLRERALVFGAGVVLIAFLLWVLALQSLVDGNRRLTARLAGHNSTLATLSVQTQEFERQRAIDPDAAVQAQIADIDRQLAEFEATLMQRQGGLVAPERMADLVKGLLGRTPGLQLVALKTLPVAPLADAAAAGGPATPAVMNAAATNAAGLYKHGLDLTVEGRFGDLLAYATQLENLPVRVLWNRTRIDALAYPKVTMTLTLYTLSLERTWLQL